jgi:hypothetical protein
VEERLLARALADDLTDRGWDALGEGDPREAERLAARAVPLLAAPTEQQARGLGLWARVLVAQGEAAPSAAARDAFRQAAAGLLWTVGLLDPHVLVDHLDHGEFGPLDDLPLVHAARALAQERIDAEARDDGR